MSTRRVSVLVWSARLAIGFGLFLAIAEVRRNWGDWEWWPWWLVDYIAVGLLLWGGRVALSAAPRVGPLCGGWGFTVCMFYASFFSHLEHLGERGSGPIEPMQLFGWIGVLFATSIVGFVLALVASHQHRAD
ncbi:MAG: hypothetical protein HYR72_17835 [Deltaproteobacteria bacterium]|nr:hypothetical protein [Deltaproteobacteria bacterium]MBI3386419.1 hypothetical protein [Deltaproteobacteria bacterium]